MKSKTAQDHIDSLDFWVKVGENRQTLVVHFSEAEKAVEIAEQEMREKAIEAYIKSCDFNAPGCCGCKNTKGECDCEQLKDFITELDNN